MTDLPLPPPTLANDYPSLRRGRYAQYVLGLVALLLAMDAGIVALLLEPIKLDLGLTDVQAGIANSTSFALAYGVLSVPLGLWVDRTNRVRLLALAMLLWAASLGLATFAMGFWTLAVAKALMGAATAASLPAALSLFGDYFAPERRASATTTYPLGSILGGAAAVLLGGLGFDALSKLHAADASALGGLTPWRAVFAIAAVSVLPILGLILMMREPKRMEVREQGGGTWRGLWTYRGFLIPLLAGVGLLTGMSSSVNTWAAPALMRLYHQQPGDFAGWYAAVILGSGGVGVAASGRLVSWAQRSGGYSAVMIPAALGALICAPASAMGMAPGVTLFAGALTVFQLAVSVAIVVPVIAINFLIPNELRGRAFGLYIISGAIGSSLSAPAVAGLSGLLGGEHMLGYAMAGVGAPMAIMAAACLAKTAKSSPKRHTGPTASATSPQALPTT